MWPFRIAAQLCSVQSFALSGDFWHSVLLIFETNIVLGTTDKVHFAGTYQEVSSSAQAAAGVARGISLYWLTWRKKRKKPYQKTHHEKLLSPLILLNNVTSSYELVLSNKTSGCMGWGGRQLSQSDIIWSLVHKNTLLVPFIHRYHTFL